MKKSVLTRHRIEKHDGNKNIEFEMKLVKSCFKNPLRRQCWEANMIRDMPEDKKINNKKEYLQPEDIIKEYSKNNEKKKKKKAKKKQHSEEVLDTLIAAHARNRNNVILGKRKKNSNTDTK